MRGEVRSGFTAACLVVAAVAVVAPAGQEARPGDALTAVGGSRWTAHNAVRLLSGPQEAWEARLDIVERAIHHVHITTFSWHNDEYGKLYREKLVEAIRSKRRRNPEFAVRILVDSTARGIFDASFSKLKEAGAEVRSFNPGTWGIAPMYDVRMHDKMIVADGRWAIVGGRNISDDYFRRGRWWLDFGVALEGEAVHDLQMHFLNAWVMSGYLDSPHRIVVPPEVLTKRVGSLLTTGRLPNGNRPIDPYLNDRYFPPAERRADGLEVAILYDSPLIRSRAATTDLLIRLVSAARHEVDLMTPFPNFPTDLTDELEAAAERGVKVRLFINGQDAAIRRGPFLLAGVPTVAELFERGVEVWAWEGNGEVERFLEESGCAPAVRPPMALHGKVVRIDRELTVVHSSNFNIRSTYYNTEAGALVRDAAFNAEMKQLLDGLVSLRDLRVECGNGIAAPSIEKIVRRLDAGDIEELRELLAGKQKFLDSMGVLW